MLALICLIIAVIVFLIACFPVASRVNLIALGLVFFAASFLLGDLHL